MEGGREGGREEGRKEDEMKMKCLAIRLTRSGQNIYEDNFETVLKDTKTDLNS